MILGALCALGLAAVTVALAQGKVAGLLFSESFDDDGLLGRGWYDGSRLTISHEHPVAGAGCMEYRWEEGGTSPANSSGFRHLFEPTEAVYLRFYLRLSPGWGWSGRSYHPHLIDFLTTANPQYQGPASSHLTVTVEPAGGKLRIGAADNQNADAPHGPSQGPLRGGYNGNHYDSAEVLFKDSEWHLVEAMVKLNSLDREKDQPNPDGQVRGWVDGKLVTERTDVIFRTTDFPDMKFNQFLLVPYFGQGLLPHAQTLWVDELAVATERVGPVEKAGPSPQMKGSEGSQAR
jgi:hypothetical protein